MREEALINLLISFSKPLWIALFFVFKSSVANAYTNTEIPDDISSVLKSFGIPASAISIVVQALDENEPRLSVNSEVQRSPASLIKVIPTWASLEILGPTYTWRTEVYSLGPIKDGTLQGDLLIKGYGDPYLLIEDLWHIAGELSRRGIRDIVGNLLIDSTYFLRNTAATKPIDGDPSRLYNVVPSAVMVNFKWIDFVINPSENGKGTVITTIPALPNLRVSNSVKLSEKPCSGNHPRIFISLKNSKADEIKISGTLPKTCRDYVLSRTALTPESYLYGLFKLLWKQWGGTISGGYIDVGPNYAVSRQVFYTWKSKPLAEIIRPLNKWSNNLMARSLVYSIGGTVYGAPATREKGIEAIKQYISRQGISVSNLLIENGSGLSRSTRATASLINDIFRRAWSSPNMPEFVASLSIAGKDGTTRNRFKGSKFGGKMRIKTGTMKNVSSAGGYVFGASGKIFSVVFLANYSKIERVSGSKIQEALLNWTANL